ncbi:hypothetical protein ACFXB4_12120 [Streptomyces lavendulae]
MPANEVIATLWDPVSEQPQFKNVAAAPTLAERADGQSAPYAPAPA